CAAPHSSSFPPTTAPLQTLHMDVTFPDLRLHSDRGGEFSSDLLRDFCRGEGIAQSPVAPCRRPRLQCVGRGRLVMRRCSGSGALVPLFAIRLQTSSPPALFPASSLASPPKRLAGSFTTPPQDVTFDEPVPFYRPYPYRSAPPPPPPLFLAPGPPPVDPLLPQGSSPSGVSQVDPLPGTVPLKVAGDSGAARGAASGGAGSGGEGPGGAEPEGGESWGTGPEGAEPKGVEPGGVEPRGAEPEGVELGGAKPWGAASSGAIGARGARITDGTRGIGGTVTAGPGGARTRGTRAAGTGCVGGAGAGAPTEPGATAAGGTNVGGAGDGGAGAGGTGAGGAGAGGTGAGGAGAGGAGAVDPGDGGFGDTLRRRLYFVPLLQQSHVARLLATATTDPSFESAATSALVAELLDFAAACRLDYATALVAEFESASPPSVGGECALGTDILEDRQEDFECLAGAVPRFASMLLAPEGDPDALDIPTPHSYAEAIRGPYSSQWQAAMDAEMASWKSTGTYVDATFSPTSKITTLRVLLHVAAQRDYKFHSLDFSTAFLQGSLHEEIWLHRPPGFTESFPAGTQWSLRRPVYGLRQAPREWHDILRTTLAALGFAPSTADPTLFLRTDTSLPPFYILVYVDDLVFATADTEAMTLVKSELQKRHTCTDLVELRSYLGLQITRDRARRTITLTQLHMVHQVLQRFGFQFSSPQPTPLSTSHSLSAPPLDESVEPSGPYPELVGCLMYLMTCTRPDLAYPLSLLARYVALVQYVGHGARAWRTGSICSHWSRRRFLG
ncbi:unnamed protein product, partial [Closterium sp. NIES-54]